MPESTNRICATFDNVKFNMYLRVKYINLHSFYSPNNGPYFLEEQQRF
jgi:hypothetical protein